MASLRRALAVRLGLALHRCSARPSPQPLFRSQLGADSRYYSSEIDLSDDEGKRRLHNRLIYRSRQRGFLELDLVLGNWVEENVRAMDELHIRALEDVLDLENPDLWKWLTGQEQPPDALNNNPVFTAVQSKVIRNLDNYSAPEVRANPGQPWVRGWDDKRGQDGSPKYGNQ